MEKLLRTVLANPFDDGPRLIYADEVEDRGNSKFAAFNRNQIAGKVDSISRSELTPFAKLFGVKANTFLISPAKGKLTVRTSNRNPTIIFRRGFVDEIRCNFAKWMGQRCGSCHGTGFGYVQMNGDARCVKCKGTLRTQGIAKSSCELWPITRVWIHDRGSMYCANNHRRSWFKAANNMYGSSRWNLPECITNLMIEESPEVDDGNSVIFANSGAAMLSLSNASVNFGRDLAKLPRIKMTTASD